MGIFNVIGNVAGFAVKASCAVVGAALNQGMRNMNTMNNARFNSGNVSDSELRARARDTSRSVYERAGSAAAFIDRQKNNQ